MRDWMQEGLGRIRPASLAHLNCDGYISNIFEIFLSFKQRHLFNCLYKQTAQALWRSIPKNMFFFSQIMCVCGGMIGVGEEEDWEISVLMNELEVSLLFVFQKKKEMKQHPCIY